MFGWTDNYLRVALPYDEHLTNEIVSCSLDELTTDGFFKGPIISVESSKYEPAKNAVQHA